MAYSWHEAQFEVHGKGFSRDISAQGIFVVCDEPPPEKSHVQLEVFLPTGEVTEARVSLRAAGQVVRRDEVGFAAIAEFTLSKNLLHI